MSTSARPPHIIASVSSASAVMRPKPDQATFGDCTTTLGDWTGGRKFDERNSVTVDVGSGTLSSSTRTALIQDRSVNACAIGVDGRWEIIQFRTATLQSAGVYKLTGPHPEFRAFLRQLKHEARWIIPGMKKKPNAKDGRDVRIDLDGRRFVAIARPRA